MKKARRKDVPQDRSVVPSIEEREGRLKEMLEQAEARARERVREAEEEARRHLEAAREQVPHTIERRRQEARAGLEAEVRGERPDPKAAAREVEERAAGRMEEAVRLVVSAVWGSEHGR